MKPCTTCGLGKSGDHDTYLSCIAVLKQVLGRYRTNEKASMRYRLCELEQLVKALNIRLERLEQ